jgi:hypothetical protein
MCLTACEDGNMVADIKVEEDSDIPEVGEEEEDPLAVTLPAVKAEQEVSNVYIRCECYSSACCVLCCGRVKCCVLVSCLPEFGALCFTITLVPTGTCNCVCVGRGWWWHKENGKGNRKIGKLIRNFQN